MLRHMNPPEPALPSMSSFEIYTPTAEEVRSSELGGRIRQFNYRYVGEYGEVQPVWLSAKDSDSRLVGGVRGFVFLNWFRIDILFVDEAVRRAGLGSKLLAAAEKNAQALGARNAALETFEWQARDFYIKQGYEEFARIDGYVKGFYLAHMKKSLQP